MMERLIVVKTIYEWYPLMSPLEYDNWLTEEYGYFVRRRCLYQPGPGGFCGWTRS